MPTPKPHADVIKAWADGYEVQMSNGTDNNWIDIPNPSFYPEVKYRVKPETQNEKQDETI